MNNLVDVASQSRFQRALTIYVFFGMFSIDFFFYASYYYFAVDLPNSEILLLARIGGDQLFPALGFGLPILPAIVASVICYASTRISGVLPRALANLFAVSIASLASATFLPASIPSLLLQLVFISVVGVITLVRHPSFALAQIPVLNEEMNPHLLVRVLELVHNRLSLVVRESIWAIISLVIAAASVMFLYISNFAGPIMSSIPSLRVFYQVQTILFGGFLLYLGGGYGASVSLMLYEKMGAIEKMCWERLGSNEK